MKKIIYLISFAMLMIIVGCSTSSKLELRNDTFIVELGDSVSLDPAKYLEREIDKDVLKEVKLNSPILEDSKKYDIDNKQLKTKDKNYLDVGTYKFTLEYKKDITEFNIIVKDTKAPTFKNILKEIVIEQNAEDVDFTNFFEAEDLSDFKVTVDNKEVDLTQTGSYKLKVTATDKYKNKNTDTVTVKVVPLEDAEKENGTTKTLDGTVYQSKALKDKITEEKKTEQQNENTNTENRTGNSSSNSNYSGSSNNSSSGGSSNNSSSGGGNVCVAGTPNPSEVGNSGLFLTQAEMDALWDFWEADRKNGWVNFEAKYGHSSFSGTTVAWDTCGNNLNNTVWTVQWLD